MARRGKEELTLREKCHLLHGKGYWEIHGVKRLGLPAIEVHDGPFGVRKVQGGNPDPYDAEISTCFPSPALLACSWDPALEHVIGEVMGKEAASKDVALLLTPGVNIKRNPLCGRNFEYLSEDPLLSGKMAAGFIRGVQSANVGACVKHFACNSQESYRNISDSMVDERALNEIYLKPFEIAVKESNPWAVMCSYNLVNGVHASDSDYLLKDILRTSWRYRGVTMSDWGGTYDPIDSHNHGLDLEMPCPVKNRSRSLLSACRAGRLKVANATESAERIVEMLKKASKQDEGYYDPNASHELAKIAAQKSIVLLRNEGRTLPLTSFRDACVIGAFAEQPRYQGNGSSFVRTLKATSFLEATDHQLPYAKGYDLDHFDSNPALVREAVDLASTSKKVLLFLGLPDSLETEGVDRKSFNLPDNQLSLFDAIYSSNPNIIVCLSVGAPVALPFIEETKAVLVDYLAGEAGAEALCDLLLGKVSPSGKLAETWPLHLADVPSFGYYPGFEGQALYKESIYVGYRYYLSANKPVLYPFGHGLSYAKFSYALSLSKKSISSKEICLGTVQVTNRSKRASEVVVELYAEPEKKNVFKAKRTLIAFSKVRVNPDESVSVDFPLAEENFAHYDLEQHRFMTEPGTYKIQVGESSESIVAEGKLVVSNDNVFPSLRDSCPVYYAVPKEGFVGIDDEFEALLGRVVPLDKTRHERPFNMDSTMNEISWTKIGKLMRKLYMMGAYREGMSEAEKSFLLACFEENPIRSLSVAGLNVKQVQAILDFANGHYLLGIFHAIFGKRKRK